MKKNRWFLWNARIMCFVPEEFVYRIHRNTNNTHASVSIHSRAKWALQNWLNQWRKEKPFLFCGIPCQLIRTPAEVRVEIENPRDKSILGERYTSNLISHLNSFKTTTKSLVWTFVMLKLCNQSSWVISSICPKQCFFSPLSFCSSSFSIMQKKETMGGFRCAHKLNAYVSLQCSTIVTWYGIVFV